MPMMTKAIGSTNVPQPAICEMVFIHQFVSGLRWADIRLKKVNKPINASAIPRISNFRSVEIWFHCHGCLELLLRLEVLLAVEAFGVREELLEREALLLRLDVDFPERDLEVLDLLFDERLTGAFAKDTASRLSERLF
jgi:hypothetical protein